MAIQYLSGLIKLKKREYWGSFPSVDNYRQNGRRLL